MSHPSLVQTLYEQTLARAKAGQPHFNEPVTALQAIAIGNYLTDNAVTPPVTFRVLCNCATATPKEHTLRKVLERKLDFSWPSEEELAEALRPRVVTSQEVQPHA